jgi:hypothetical protein
LSGSFLFGQDLAFFLTTSGRLALLSLGGDLRFALYKAVVLGSAVYVGQWAAVLCERRRRDVRQEVQTRHDGPGFEESLQ